MSDEIIILTLILGDIIASVHTQVLDYYKEDFVPGCVIILRQVYHIIYKSISSSIIRFPF